MTELRFLTTDEVAMLTRRSRDTVRRWIREGRLRAVKVGGRLLVPESSFLAMISGESLAVEEFSGHVSPGGGKEER